MAFKGKRRRKSARNRNDIWGLENENDINSRHASIHNEDNCDDLNSQNSPPLEQHSVEYHFPHDDDDSDSHTESKSDAAGENTTTLEVSKPLKRKIHLTLVECSSLSETSHALSKPFEVPRSTRPPNRRLQPRDRKRLKRYSNPILSNPVGSHIDSTTIKERAGASTSSSDFVTATSCVSTTRPSSQPVHQRKFENIQTSGQFSQPARVVRGFSASSSLLGLTHDQIAVGGFASEKGVVAKTFKRVNDKLKRAKDSAGNDQKSITNFFTKTIPCKTSQRVKMETNSDEESTSFVPVSCSPSKMYSPIVKMPDSDVINISDSSPEKQTHLPKGCQNQRVKMETNSYEESTNFVPVSCSQSKMYSPIEKVPDSDVTYISDSSPKQQTHLPKGRRKHTMQLNTASRKLFEGEKSLAADMVPQKKKKPNVPPSTSQSSVSMTVSNPNSCEYNYNSNASKCSGHDELYKQTYGLIGQHSRGSGLSFGRDSPQINYFEDLPYHIIEHIFSQLPILDLCLNSNRVCRQWNDVISDPKFVPWKKRYYQLKKKHGNAFAEIQSMMDVGKMTIPGKYLKALIRYMRDFKPVTASNMNACLKQHPKFLWASALIKERIPECIEHEEVSPWSVIAALVVISETVGDIQAIIASLTVSQSQCTSMEVLECLYCVANFLYAFHLAAKAVWTGMHYRVFYAIYLYENSSVSNHGMLQEAMDNNNMGQQSMVKYGRSDTVVRLTHEQVRIIKHSPKFGDTVKIVAFAGTGKTTTLVRYTKMRPSLRFLLVVFNKSVQQYAIKQFPGNVVCKTGHSLAFAHTGRRYAKKLRNLKVQDVFRILPPRKGDSYFVRAKFVMETINSYCSSAEENITTTHVPLSRKDDQGNLVVIDHEAKMRYAEDAEYLWDKMKDVEDKRIGMTHDGYLKLYQLSKPKLDHYDMILIDEAQDMTPAVIDILLKQSQAKILVGDPHQQIYSFRGAVNAMSVITSSETFYLTQSFRFGPEIAQVAAYCLEVFKDVREKTIVGHGTAGHIDGVRVGQLAVISRLNFTVFSEAVKKCVYSETNQKVAFAGGTDSFGFPMILDIYCLMLSEEQRKKEKRQIANPFIKSFPSLVELEKYATKVSDVELGGKIRIVKTFHHSIPMCISKIRQKCVKDLAQADIVFSTAHKAKGLEFSTVMVTDDFLNIPMGGSTVLLRDIVDFARVPPDEVNLLYVAVTRAKHSLLMSPTLLRVLKDNGERFEFPALSKQLETSGIPFKCFQTDAEFQPQVLTLRRKDITIGEGDEVKGGLFGPQILSEDFHGFAELLGDPSVEVKQKPAAGDLQYAMRAILGRAMFVFDPNDDDDDDDEEEDDH